MADLDWQTGTWSDRMAVWVNVALEKLLTKKVEESITR